MLSNKRQRQSQRSHDFLQRKISRVAQSLAGPHKLVLLVLVALSVASLGVAAYFYVQFQSVKQNPQRAAEGEMRALVERVGKLIVLPSDERPTIATVVDPETLQEQPFFANAKKGDRVLIYAGARKAILYDPVNNRIVEVAPINLGDPQQLSDQEALFEEPAGE